MNERDLQLYKRPYRPRGPKRPVLTEREIRALLGAAIYMLDDDEPTDGPNTPPAANADLVAAAQKLRDLLAHGNF